MFFKFCEKFNLGLPKYDKYGKNNEQYPSSIFRPVGLWERAKTWVKNIENKMLFEFREKYILELIKNVEYGKNDEGHF